MKTALVALVGLGTLCFSSLPGSAQTTENGPYYAKPSWDQQLPATTRFIVLINWGDNAVLDRETGLVWERTPANSGFTGFVDANLNCLNVNTGGRQGWRLPKVEELLSLTDGSPTGLPSGHPFQGVSGDQQFWTSTADPAVAGRVLGVDFFPNENEGAGTTALAQTDGARFWCVRGGAGTRTE